MYEMSAAASECGLRTWFGMARAVLKNARNITSDKNGCVSPRLISPFLPGPGGFEVHELETSHYNRFEAAFSSSGGHEVRLSPFSYAIPPEDVTPNKPSLQQLRKCSALPVLAGCCGVLGIVLCAVCAQFPITLVDWMLPLVVTIPAAVLVDRSE